MQQIWKDVLDYQGFYQVSNIGRVKRLVGWKCKHEKILKPYKSKDGYMQLVLYKDKVKVTKRIHILVAEAFIRRIDKQNEQCHHVNHISTDNRAENLKIISKYQHRRDPIAHQNSRLAQIGKKLSDQTKRKMSQAHKGNKNWNYGTHLSQQTKQKIRQKRLQRVIKKDPVTGRFIKTE